MFNELFGILFMIAGTGMLFYTLVQISRAIRSLRWPVTPGAVVDTALKEHRGRFGGFEPVVRYRYEWDGRSYEGSRLVFSATTVLGPLEQAEALLTQMPVGSRIPVRVCPAKIQLSVIQPGFERGLWFPLAWSVMAILGGLTAWSKP